MKEKKGNSLSQIVHDKVKKRVSFSVRGVSTFLSLIQIEQNDERENGFKQSL